MKIHPVILSGGSGTRLWPLSRAALPKQLLPLVSGLTMLQETVLRVAGRPGIAAPLIVCGDDHRFLVAEQMRQIGVEPHAIMLEPQGRNTAPAIGVAAYHLRKDGDDDALMLVLPADHVIRDVEAFNAAIAVAASVAQGSSRLATFGIVPSAPESGYGYIRRGEEVDGAPGCYMVEQFVEKPDRETAQQFLDDGRYSWNSGMFLFRAGAYLDELERLQPQMAACCSDAVRDAYGDLSFCRLSKEAYAKCPSESIDFAVMEHTQQAVVIPADIGWSDVGSWSALADVHEHDDLDRNVLHGDIYTDGVSDSFVRAESRFVAVLGLDNVIVVETKDAVLIADRNDVQRVKQVVDYLKQEKRCEHLNHTKVYRPWGSYESIDDGHRYQVKRITVDPGEKLSLQMHHHRAEHWIVVTGTALVTCGDDERLLTENESIYIPIGTQHRLENPGKMPLHLIEVQSGAYLGEDDIVRFEDVYQRA